MKSKRTPGHLESLISEAMKDAVQTLVDDVMERIGQWEELSGNRLPRDEWTITLRPVASVDGHLDIEASWTLSKDSSPVKLPTASESVR